MSETEDFVRFEGRDASEAEEFIRSINIRAFSANKLKDDGWIAMLASTAFVGQGLRWYRSLSPPTRDSWEALQNALLSNYQSSGATPSSIPTAPAAGPPAQHVISQPQQQIGRIRARSQSQLVDMAYLCGDITHNGVFMWKSDVSRALTVRYSPEGQSLEMLDGNFANCFVGAQFWYYSSKTSTLGRGGTGYLELTPVKRTSAGYTSSLTFDGGRLGVGEIFVGLWNVGNNGALLPLVSQHGVRYCPNTYIFTKTRELVLVSDFAAFSKYWKPERAEGVHLVFEPL